MYEACTCLIWDKFIKWVAKWSSEEHELVENVHSSILSLKKNVLDPNYFCKVSVSSAFNVLFTLYEHYLDNLCNKNETMSKFLMSYIDLTGKLLQLLRASRERNWDMHFLAVENIKSWCVVYNHSNFTRYLQWYSMQMRNLTKTYPATDKYL